MTSRTTLHHPTFPQPSLRVAQRARRQAEDRRAILQANQTKGKDA